MTILIPREDGGRPHDVRLCFDPQAGLSFEISTRLGGSEPPWEGGICPSDIDATDVHGNPVALLQCYDVLGNSGLGNFTAATRKIYVSAVLIGAQTSTENEKCITGITIDFTNVRAWRWGRASWDTSRIDESADKCSRGFVVTTSSLPEIVTNISEDESELRVSHRVAGSMSRTPEQFSIMEFTTVRLNKREHETLDQTTTDLYSVQCFFSLLCGSPVFANWVELTLTDLDPDTDKPKRVSWVTRRVRPSVIRHLHPVQVLLPYSCIADCFESVWSNWLSKWSVYYRALDLYLADDLAGLPWGPERFISKITALEALHRRLFDGRYMDEAEYEKAIESVRAAIPSALGKDHRQALQSRLRYGNEYSFRRRLKELAEGLPIELRRILHPDLVKYLERAIETRNHLVHHAEDRPENVFSGQSLRDATQVLRGLFVCTILLDLGVPVDVLQSRLPDWYKSKFPNHRPPT